MLDQSLTDTSPYQDIELQYLHETKNLPLLEKAFELFKATWPDHYPTSETVFSEINNAEESRWKPFVMVVGRNLDDPQKAEIMGYAYSAYFSESQTAANVYLVVAPEHRRHGLGEIINDLTQVGLDRMSKKEGHELQASFLEINDPKKHTTEADGLDPETRKQIFENWGAGQIDLPYAQPPWDETGEQDDTYLLMAFPVAGKMPNAQAVQGFITSVYDEYAGMTPEYIQNNAPFQNMSQWLYKHRHRNDMSVTTATDEPNPSAPS